MIIASCIRDAAPDAWGRRAMAGHFVGHTVPEAAPVELACLRASGSDRIGALDFQDSATGYVARESDESSLENIMDAARHVDRGMTLPPAQDWRFATALPSAARGRRRS